MRQHDDGAVERVVSLGCGEAPLEHLLLQQNVVDAVALVDFVDVLSSCLFAFVADDQARLDALHDARVTLIDATRCDLIDAAVCGATVLICFGSFRDAAAWQRPLACAEPRAVLVFEDGASCEPSVDDVALFLDAAMWRRVDLPESACPTSTHGVVTIGALFVRARAAAAGAACSSGASSRS